MTPIFDGQESVQETSFIGTLTLSQHLRKDGSALSELLERRIPTQIPFPFAKLLVPQVLATHRRQTALSL